MASAPPREEAVGGKRFADFHLSGKTFIVTGGARGLGLAIAEALVEAGAKGTNCPRHNGRGVCLLTQV